MTAAVNGLSLDDIIEVLDDVQAPMTAFEIAYSLECEIPQVLRIMEDAEDGWWKVQKFSDGEAGGWRYRTRKMLANGWRARWFDRPGIWNDA